MQEQPNIFRWATSELSQDAFICWLLEWADQKYSANEVMHKAGLSLLNALLKQHDAEHCITKAPQLKITKQFYNMDIVVEINHDTILLIEDKTNTTEHGKQLETYKQTLQEKLPDRKRYLYTFFKTGDQSSYDAVTEAGYELFLRKDFLDVLSDHQVDNDIYNSFYNYLSDWDKAVNSYEETPVKDWNNEPRRWIGFFQAIKETGEFENMGWGYVHNPNGGFYGAWFPENTFTNGAQIYLQLNQDQLEIRMSVSKATTADIPNRQFYQKKLLQLAETSADIPCLHKFGRQGKTFALARSPKDAWMVTENDIIDLNATIENIKAMSFLIQKIAKQL